MWWPVPTTTKPSSTGPEGVSTHPRNAIASAGAARTASSRPMSTGAIAAGTAGATTPAR